MEEGLKRRRPECSSQPKTIMMRETWISVYKAMVKLFEKGVELNNDEYMQLYSKMYNFCHNRDEGPSNKVGRYTCASYSMEYHDVKILYGAIQKYLLNRVTTLENLMIAKINENTDDNSKLEFYINHSTIFFRAARQLNGICEPMNKLLAKFVYSVNGCKKTGSYEFHPIISLPNMLWKQSKMLMLGREVVGYIMKFIAKGREGESVPQKTIEATISSLLKLGYDPLKTVGLFAYINSSETKALSITEAAALRKAKLEEIELSSYRKIFEEQFLFQTSEFYAKQISTLPNLSSLDFVKLVQSWKEKEVTQARNYGIHPTTETKLLENFFRLTIKKNKEKFFNGISEIFAINNVKESLGLSNISEFLNNMKNLIIASKDQGNYSAFLEEFEKVIVVIITSQLQKGCKKDKSNLKNAHFYIDIFLDWYDTFLMILGLVLNDNHRDQFEILKGGFQKVLKENFFTTELKRKGKTNEFFASKYHMLLIAKNKNTPEKTQELKKFKKLFEILPDQSGFARCYQMFLAKRLADRSYQANAKLEDSILEDFEDVLGTVFTTRIRRLIKDGTTTSQALVDNFKKSLDGPIPFDFTASVFSSANCQWKAEQEIKTFKICPDIAPYCDSLSKYISNSSLPTKSLQWLHNMSRVEVEVSNCFNDNKSYTVCCSVYQMTVLSMFNDEESHTFENIVTVTGLNENIASRVIKGLLKANLLLHEKASTSSSSERNEMQKEDKIFLNRAFTSATERIFVSS